MIGLAPRMMELGWAEEAIFDAFKQMYDLGDDSSKDREIQKVIRNARKYVRNGVPVERGDKFTLKPSHFDAIRQRASEDLSVALDQYCWSIEEVRSLGWCQLSPLEQRREFLSTMFDEDEVIWSGDKYDSGKPKHAFHFLTVSQWISARGYPFLSHCTFKPGVFSRSNENVMKRKYLVMESDRLSHDETLAVFNWLHHAKNLPLRAVVFSGRRSIHGWFDRPTNDDRELAAFVEGLKCDPATLRASQPVRLAGVRRRETGRIQELLYLANSAK
jgi:hypothetical protein